MVGPRPTGPPARGIQDILRVRDKARRDLWFLSRHLLGYSDIEEGIHDPFIDACMIKWRGAPLGVDTYTGIPPFFFSYQPPSEELGGCLSPGFDWPRKRLLLVFRSSFKTTINVICDLIQTHLRFPRLASQVFHAVEDKATAIKQEIAKHWTDNDAMKYYFPDYYAHSPGERRKYESGGGFFSNSRISSTSLAPQRKEETVSANALGKASASAHVDLIKFTDIVDPTNSTTENQCEKVWKLFQMARNLLSDPYKLIDVEGTIYSPFDTYQRLLDLYWDNIEEYKRQTIWHVTYIPALRKKDQTYTPNDAKKPWAVASKDILLPSGKTLLKDKPIPYWPVWRGNQPRLDTEALAEYERDDPEGYAGQMLLLPYTERGGGPFDVRNLRLVPMAAVHQLVRTVNYKRVVIDTAETMGDQSCNTAIFYAEHTRTGRVVVRYGRVERMGPADLLDTIWMLTEKWKPDDVLIEETGFVRGLKLSMSTKATKTSIYPPFVFVRREAGSGKHDRIEGSMGIPWKEKRVLFSEEELDSLVIDQIRLEASGFRKIKQVDGLDALSDLWHPDYPMTEEGKESKMTEDQISERQRQRMIEQQWNEMLFGPHPGLGVEGGVEGDSYGF